MNENPEIVEGLSDVDWKTMEKESGNLIIRYLRTDDPALEKRVKIAQVVLSAATRRQATQGAREALHYAVARGVSTNAAELAEYVRLTQPSFPQIGNGATGRGLARHGEAMQGKDSPDSLDTEARLGRAGQGRAKQGKDSPDSPDARHGQARQGTARPGEAQQGKDS